MKTEPWKKAYAFKPDLKIEPRTAYSINDESQTEVAKEDLISGISAVCFSFTKIYDINCPM